MLSKGRKIPKEHQLNHKVAEMRLVQNLKFYEVNVATKCKVSLIYKSIYLNS